MQRNTKQRQIILETFLKMKNHLTIDEVYSEVHKEHPAISKATVYRDLRHLAKNGLIRQVSQPDELERYDERTDQHYHFKCKSCCGIFDVDIPYLVDINETVKQKFDFEVEKNDIVFSGVCSECKRKTI